MTTTISGTSGVTFPAGGIGNPAGAVLGTTDTQTITNKTLSTGLVMAASVITASTSQASTSGTSITFTGIPSWAERITVLFNGVSTSGTSLVQVQIGSGSVTTTGYSSNAQSSGANQSLTSGFVVDTTGSAAYIRGGALRISNITGNTWVADGTVGSIGTFTASCVGYIALAGVLDRVVVTTVNGTDTFDAGSINIQYE